MDYSNMTDEYRRMTRRCPRCGRRHLIAGIETECLVRLPGRAGKYERKLIARAERESRVLDDIQNAFAVEDI